MKIGSLFAGYAGLEMGVQSVLGGDTAWFSEIDPAPSKILAHHWPTVPNLGDITTVDWATVEPVDILTGGFPCQDVSLAGLRRGLRPDTRSGLWSHFAQAIDVLRPELVIVENVRGLLSAEAHSDLEPDPWALGDGNVRPALRALGAVLGDLADLGYDAEWRGIRAADAGAPHGRFRVFIAARPAADTDHRERERRRGPGGPEGPDRSDDRATARDGDPRRLRETAPDSGRPAADAAHVLEHGGRDARDGRPEPANRDRAPRHPESGDRRTAERDLYPPGWGAAEPREPTRENRCALDWGSYGPAVRRWERITGRPAPAPTGTGARGAQQLSARFVEWMMGLPAGHVTDPAIGLTRNEQLKALGNGVVPQQAALALTHLLDRKEQAA